MSYFFARLIPPRGTFSQDMTPHEAEVMKQHIACWSRLAEGRVAMVFGPVADPKGVWGMGIIEAKEETEMRKLQESDPAIKERLGHPYETYAMPRVIMRPQRPGPNETETKGGSPGQDSEGK